MKIKKIKWKKKNSTKYKINEMAAKRFGNNKKEKERH